MRNPYSDPHTKYLFEMLTAEEKRLIEPGNFYYQEVITYWYDPNRKLTPADYWYNAINTIMVGGTVYGIDMEDHSFFQLENAEDDYGWFFTTALYFMEKSRQDMYLNPEIPMFRDEYLALQFLMRSDFARDKERAAIGPYWHAGTHRVNRLTDPDKTHIPINDWGRAEIELDSNGWHLNILSEEVNT